MLSPEKKIIYHWFQELKSNDLSPKHFKEIALEKRKNIKDEVLLKYFDLLLFQHTSKKFKIINRPFIKSRNKVSNRRGFTNGPKKQSKVNNKWIHFISTPMGGQNKN